VDFRPLTRVDIALSSNLWWDDTFQFGDPSDFTWNFSGATFYLNVTTEPIGSNPVLLTCSSALGNIIVSDTVNRILTMNVSDITLRAAFGNIERDDLRYDLVMQTNSTGVVDGLMYGHIDWTPGVTMTGT
jgi:hypothetical protein